MNHNAEKSLLDVECKSCRHFTRIKDEVLWEYLTGGRCGDGLCSKFHSSADFGAFHYINRYHDDSACHEFAAR